MMLFVVKARISMVSLVDCISWMIFKMLALEQSAEKWPFSTVGGGRPTAPTPLGYGTVTITSELDEVYKIKSYKLVSH